jgi:hypothetical protein
MFFLFLPFFSNALNVTDHARTGVEGRFSETYDCEEYFSDPDWDLLDPDDEEYQFCEAFGHWQEGCFGEKGVKIMNCDGPMCVPEWKSSDGDCQTYQKENYCTEEGEYDIGWNEIIDGEFKLGTNGLNAFEACSECGACSAEDFLENSEAVLEGYMLVIIILVAFGTFAICCLCCLCCKACCRKEAPTTAQAPVQPVVQPTTNIVIQTQQFQPQQPTFYQRLSKGFRYQPPPPAPYGAPPSPYAAPPAPYATPPAPYAAPASNAPPPLPQQNNWGPVAGQI